MRPRRRNPERVPGGEALLQRMYTRIGCDGRPPHFCVEFYPYSSLVLTIRRREDMLYVRFSDLLARAPRDVMEAAGALLLARVYRKRVSPELVQPYLVYAHSERTRSRVQQMRRQRARSAPLVAEGEHHDLSRMFGRLNQQYFRGRLGRPQLGWSTQNWRRQFGSYDPGPDRIILNRRLDRPGIPQRVVEYVLFHELLHLKHPSRRSGCSLVSHSREFRAEERRFAHYSFARKFLDRLTG